jgi:WD40 repeat protein
VLYERVVSCHNMNDVSTLRIWNMNSGICVMLFDIKETISLCLVTSDYLLSGNLSPDNYSMIKVWELRSAACIKEIETKGICALTKTANEILIIYNAMLRTINLKTGQTDGFTFTNKLLKARGI